MSDWKIKRQVLRAASFAMVLFGLLAVYIIYLSTWEADDLAKNPLNMRRAAARADIQRGSILAADGQILAETRQDGSRVYPFGTTMAAVTGYNGENIGSAGIEGHANQALLGLTADMSRLGPLSQLLQSERGNDVKLTIEPAAQKAAAAALGKRRGAVVALDARTGAVLAMVSSPSYDPNDIESNWKALSGQEDSPLLNRAVQGLYPPGSTIKAMIADAALTDGVTNTSEVFDCDGVLDVGGGHTIRESHGEVHGRVDLRQAVTESCNITFGTLSKGDQAQTAIGQSALLVTPMHMALLADAFANGGKIMKPYLVQDVITPGGTVVYKAQPSRWLTATTPEMAALIDSYVEDVVTKGTGTAARVQGVRVTGKTGTAENPAGKDHAWFIGSAELPERKIVFAIIVENGGGGGIEAAPIAKQMIESLM